MNNVFTVYAIDLDAPKNCLTFSKIVNHINGSITYECTTLREAIELVDKERRKLHSDAFIVGVNVPSKYSAFEFCALNFARV